MLLLLNLLLVAYLFVLFSMLAATFAGQPDSGVSGLAWEHFFVFVGTAALLAVGGLSMLAVSLLHLFRSALPQERKILWLVAMMVGADVAMLVYWFLHVRKAEPSLDEPALA